MAEKRVPAGDNLIDPMEMRPKVAKGMHTASKASSGDIGMTPRSTQSDHNLGEFITKRSKRSGNSSVRTSSPKASGY